MSYQFCISDDEARRTKLCPLTMAMAGPDGHSIGPCNCYGSDCMAWRWVETHIPDPAGGPDLIKSGDTHGYCGLAGKPWKPGAAS